MERGVLSILQFTVLYILLTLVNLLRNGLSQEGVAVLLQVLSRHLFQPNGQVVFISTVLVPLYQAGSIRWPTYTVVCWFLSTNSNESMLTEHLSNYKILCIVSLILPRPSKVAPIAHHGSAKLFLFFCTWYCRVVKKNGLVKLLMYSFKVYRYLSEVPFIYLIFLNKLLLPNMAWEVMKQDPNTVTISSVWWVLTKLGLLSCRNFGGWWYSYRYTGAPASGCRQNVICKFQHQCLRRKGIRITLHKITLFYSTVTSVGICRLNGWNGKKNVPKQLCKSISNFQSISRGS